MKISVDRVVHLQGAKTNQQERDALRRFGFVHVTGLEAYGNHAGEYIGERLTDAKMGKWSTNNGIMVIITHGGEVWLGTTPSHLPVFIPILRALCPKGEGGFVPCSNGETLNTFLVLKRLSDPDYNIVYE
ncbi:MAG: hypothetical protein WCT08_00605 [Patescibacteria group bacterium]|jgi:hypothetical protein